MTIHYFLSPYPALLQDMYARAYEVDVNGNTSQVDEILIPERNGAGVPTPGAGHQVPFEVTFAGLDFVTHEIRLYTFSGTLLHRYDRTPEVDSITIFDPIRFRIGDGGPYTPNAGDTAFVHPAMAGMTAADYTAYRNGYGYVFEGVHITNNVLGGFQLFKPGDVFSGDPAEEWTITMQNQVVKMPVNDSVVGKQWGPTSGGPDIFLDVTGTVTYVPGHLRKLIRLAGSAALYKFESSDVPPVGYIFRITNFGAYTPGDPLPKVQFNNAPLKWGNTTKTELEISLFTTPEFVWDGTNWNVSNYQFAPSTTPAINDILYCGDFNVGDISEALVTIVHGQNITVPYMVLGNFYSQDANPGRDNTCTFAIRVANQTANQFQVTWQEIFGEIQNLRFKYVLIRTA